MDYNKLFIDSDVILDLLLQRDTFFDFSSALLSGSLKPGLFTSSLILANVHYIVKKNKNKLLAKDLLSDLLLVLKVLPFESDAIEYALANFTKDFEDTIQYFIAQKNKCDVIITRNLKHYKTFNLPAFTAEQFLRTVIK